MITEHNYGEPIPLNRESLNGEDGHLSRLNSGIKNRHNFFLWAIFCFKKLGMIQSIMLILRIPKFLSNYPEMPTYSNAYEKLRIFNAQFSGNWFEFGINWIDFFSSKIWVIQIQVLAAKFKNPENPGIQPTNVIWRDTTRTNKAHILVPWIACTGFIRLYPLASSWLARFFKCVDASKIQW